MKKVLLAVGFLLFVGASFAQDCSDLFISEYVEGWSNNKALEIYNPTDQPIDLSAYLIERYSNGAQFTDAEHIVQLQGILQPHDVYVAVIDKRDENGTGQEAPVWDELQAEADGFYCPDYTVSSAMYFNGNDAVALAKGTLSDFNNAQLIDLIGKIGEDPEVGDGSVYNGWTDTAPYVGVGTVLTADHTLIRKSSIKHGVTVPPSEFNALAEWDTLPPVIPVLDSAGNLQYNQSGNLVVEGNWSTLGSHICDCGNATAVKTETVNQLAVFPNPSTDGMINFKATSPVVEIKVYNSVGKLVYSENNLKGIESIQLASNKGVYIANFKLQNGVVTTKRIVLK